MKTKLKKLSHKAQLCRLHKRTPFKFLYKRRLKEMRNLLNEEDVLKMVDNMESMRHRIDVLENIIN